jgi:hypothetical protein
MKKVISELTVTVLVAFGHIPGASLVPQLVAALHTRSSGASGFPPPHAAKSAITEAQQICDLIVSTP